MQLKKIVYGCCIIIAVMLPDLMSWTIDLPEVRKYLFQKNEREKLRSDVNNREQVFYSNIEGNSMHNTKNDNVYDNNQYAEEYGYQSYMERKVQNVVHNGSVYLEGLRRAIENYTEFLENCTRVNFNVNATNSTTNTTWRPPMDRPSFNLTENSQTIPFFSRMSASCEVATRASEHVRRLAELAAWATRELQDIAFAKNYGKDHQDGREENELILKLAWFLDRLAHLTGYEPEPHEFVSDVPLSSTTTPEPTPPSMMNAPEQVKNDMMNCLKSNSTEPATARCTYPLPLPPMVQQIFNLTDISTTPSTSSLPNETEQVLPLTSDEPIPEQSLELLVTADNRTPVENLPRILTGIKVKTVQKRSASRGLFDMSMIENKKKINPLANSGRKFMQKRSVDEDPNVKFVKYLVKYKVWANSNPTNYRLNVLDSNKNNFQEFEVKNHLTVSQSVQKRSLYSKKFKHLRLPADPTQDLSKYIKHKPGVNYVEDQIQVAKIKTASENIHNHNHLPATENVEKLVNNLKIIKKRSIGHQKLYLPRISEEPMQDISYYAKNKPGTNYYYDPIQAAQVRLALEQVFLTGNIETVRRYGSNYNPLVPAPFYVGVAKSIADS